MKYLLYLFIFTTLIFGEVKINLSHTNIKNGTSFAVILQSDERLLQAPNVIFQETTYQMFTIGGNTTKYEVFLPVDYHTKQTKYPVTISYLKNNKLQKVIKTIEVMDGNYKQNEIIKVPSGKVFLSKQNQERTKKEYDEVFQKVYSKISLYDLTNQEPFANPMKTSITSEFGNARVYNGKVNSYHTGTDFRGTIGEEVRASNHGKVVLAMERFYLGKVVYIDHGRGAYSYYSHLDEILVKEGDMVKKGQLIAKSGATGRVTGPHLHFAFRVYNTTVDPLQYMKLYNEILKKYH